MKKAVLKYSISFLAALSIAFLAFYLREGFNETDPQTLTMYIADALTIPGVLFVLFGILVWLANEGSLDGIGYVFKRLIKSLIPAGRRKEETYAEYKANKKKVSGYSFLFVTGILFLFGAGIFLIKYYTF